MSKHWNPGKKPVALKGSRIRREPFRTDIPVAGKPRTARRSDEVETWSGVAGVLVIAGVIVVAVVGLSLATIFHDDPAAAAAEARFGQCYAGGSNCVMDGDTIYVRGVKLSVAGVVVPQIQGASCEAERNQGIDAAVKLANLLNSGPVSVGPTFTDDLGRSVRTVTVKGHDVAPAMIRDGVAQKVSLEKPKGWC